MTDRTRNKTPLKRLRNQAVEVTFDGGTLTSDAGLLLLREVDQRLKLIERIARVVPDPRDPRYIIHTQAEMLTSRIFGIAAGYEDGNDHLQLRHDPAFQVAAGRTPAEMNYDDNDPLASPSTLSRLENRVHAKTVFQLHEILVDTFLNSFEVPPEEIIPFLTSTLPMIRHTEIRTRTTSMASTMVIVSCRCMSSVVIKYWYRIFVQVASVPLIMLGQ